MWLKLETGMVLMLLLFSVLRGVEGGWRRERGGQQDIEWRPSDSGEFFRRVNFPGYSQNLQRPQRPERPLLYTADVVLVQLTGGGETTTPPAHFQQTPVFIQLTLKEQST